MAKHSIVFGSHVVGRAKSKVAAHRATRRAKYAGTRVVTLNRAKHVFPPGARVLIDGRDEARVKQAFPEGSSSYLFPHYKLDIIDGDTNVAVHMSRVGVERRTLNRVERDEELAEAEAQAEIERLAEAEAQAEIDELALAPESRIEPEESMTVYEPEAIEPEEAMTVYEPPVSDVTYEEAPGQTESFHVTVTRLS